MLSSGYFLGACTGIGVTFLLAVAGYGIPLMVGFYRLPLMGKLGNANGCACIMCPVQAVTSLHMLWYY